MLRTTRTNHPHIPTAMIACMNPSPARLSVKGNLLFLVFRTDHGQLCLSAWLK